MLDHVLGPAIGFSFASFGAWLGCSIVGAFLPHSLISEKKKKERKWGLVYLHKSEFGRTPPIPLYFIL